MIERLELLISFVEAVLLLGGYAVYALAAEPSGGHPVGLALGSLGLLCMALTETLYSLRKRLGWLRFGPVRLWLSCHIVTGIVGPWLALLHTGFTFNGLAGLAMALTALVTVSGFVGRYIYTAVPRTLAGVALSRDELAARLAQLQAKLEDSAPVASAQTGRPPANPLVRLTCWGQPTERRHAPELERLLQRRQELERQMASLKTAQRLLRLWRRLHVPLGLTMFTTIAIHIGAALYYGGWPP